MFFLGLRLRGPESAVRVYRVSAALRAFACLHGSRAICAMCSVLKQRTLAALSLITSFGSI